MDFDHFLENNLHPHRRIVLESQFGEFSSFSYLFGNTKPFRINIDDFNINPIRCLFLGSGDLRNVIHLVYTSPTESNWNFHLVDINPSIIARNLILLRLINDDYCSIDILWSIWYDFLLEKSVHDRLRQEIELLSNDRLDELVRDQDKSMIRSVFREWLNRLDSNMDKSRASEQRQSHIRLCYQVAQQLSFDEAISLACQSVNAALPDDDEKIIQQARDEFTAYIKHGTTGQERNYDSVNVTMIQPNTGLYSGHYGLSPYQSFLPFDNHQEQKDFRQISSSHTPYPLFVFSQQQMTVWISNYRQHRQQVKWHFWCGDALNIALMHMQVEEFDLIHTSNLCDHVDMLNLLVTCVHLLRHRSWSQILTQSMKWRSNHARFTDYLAQLFNDIEIGWLPSLFGLVCECSRTTGFLPSKGILQTTPYVHGINTFDYQIWRLAMSQEYGWNVRCNGTDPNILALFDRIAERCFYTHLTKSLADQGTGHSTALTYYLLLRQYSYRQCFHPEETFAYLFERTCYQYQAFATSLRMIHAFLTQDDVYVCAVTKQHRAQISTKISGRIGSPVLQLVLIESNEDLAKKIIDYIHGTPFRNRTHTIAVSNSIQYDLRTGIIEWHACPQHHIRFHLIDNFAFRLGSDYVRLDQDPLRSYLEIAKNADIHFALPLCFRPSYFTAFLIDAHTWFPFALLDLTETIQKCSTSIMSPRDTIGSCFVDVCDRKKHFASHDQSSYVQLMEANETSSSYIVSMKVTTQYSSWNHTIKLASSKHAIIVVFKFSLTSIVTIRLAFACPLNLKDSRFESIDKNQTLLMTIGKDLSELISIVTLKTQTMNSLFNSTTATHWPHPQLANGMILEPRLDLPPPMVIGLYATKTAQVMDALTAMFTLSEFHMSQRQTGDHLFHDPDFDLRESIRQMFLQVFAGRQRVGWYTTKTNSNKSSHDIRSNGDILLIYEGIFDHENRPLLALSCLDMDDINDSSAFTMTLWTRNFIQRELQVQARLLQEARKNKKSQTSDYNTYDIRATKEELDLMRKLLKQNAMKTTGCHRSDLMDPWYASYVEPIQFDSRSKLASTKLTEAQQITMLDAIVGQLGCRTCKKLPSISKQLWSKCSRCKNVFYCSVACQTKDWPTHKNACVRRKTHESNTSVT